MQESKTPQESDARAPKAPDKDDNVSPEISPNGSGQNQVDTPSPNDILLGRGRPFQSHPGNKKMLRLVKERKKEYQQLSRDKKRPLVKEIIRFLSLDGGRFLKRLEDHTGKSCWEEVSHDIAFEKVCHALRTKYRKHASHPSKPEGHKIHPVVSPTLAGQFPAIMAHSTGLGLGLGLGNVNRGMLNLPLSTAGLQPSNIDLASLSLIGNRAGSVGLPLASDQLFHYAAAGLPQIILPSTVYNQHSGLVDPLTGNPRQLLGSSIYENAALLNNLSPAGSQLLNSLLRSRIQETQRNTLSGLNRLPPFL